MSASGIGRPVKKINKKWLKDAVSHKRNLSKKTISELLGINRNTLWYKLKQMKLYQRFTPISDQDLDVIVSYYKTLRPESGIRYTQGFLKKNDIHIQRDCVQASLGRVDGLGQVLRADDTMLRWKYTSSYSNGVDHIDGCHKLIQWGFVIHGIIGGHDRMVKIRSQMGIVKLTFILTGYGSTC